MTMVDHEIIKSLDDGAIVIVSDGEDIEQIRARIGVNSFDVALGRYFWRRKVDFRSNEITKGAINLDAAALYESKYCIADESIYLGPNEKILGTTHEFIGGTVSNSGDYAVLAHMHAKSSTGRYGITTNLCAGFGDVGYINRWAMEIANLDSVGKWLPVGLFVAQIEFTRVCVPSRLYGVGGSYQRGQNIDQIRQGWRPEHLLPKKIEPSKHALKIPPHRP